MDPYDSWPGYRCLICGEIVGHTNGTYHNLPPSIVNAHMHKQRGFSINQFADTVYSEDHRLVVRTDYYKGAMLDQTYSPEEVIKEFDYGNQDFKDDLNIPVNGFSSSDFMRAWLEFKNNLQNQSNQEKINDLIFYTSSLLQNRFLQDDQSFIPFSPFARLMKCKNLEGDNFSIVRVALSLSMILRTKAHKKDKYLELIASEQIVEFDLVEWVNLLYSVCPKLLEWSLSWAEIFFVHSAS